MRKILVVMIILLFTAGGLAFGQVDVTQLDTYQDAFDQFALGVANVLPMASTVGLQWSDAYIGQLPHLGFGVTAGFASIPLNTVVDSLSLLEDLTGVSASELYAEEPFATMKNYGLGLPFPAATTDLRIGGLGLPFDIGFKFGMLPAFARDEIRRAVPEIQQLDYLLWGADIRMALIKERKRSIVPDITVGGGYNYFRGKLAMGGIIDDFQMNGIILPDADQVSADDQSTWEDADTYTNTYDVNFDSPEVGFQWESHVIDFKAQISKKLLLLFTPYAGVGASYGRSRAGGGIYSGMTVSGDGNYDDLDRDLQNAIEIYEQITAAGMDPADYGMEDLSGMTIPDPSVADGFVVNQWVNGWGFRVYGGLSINLWVLKIDASIMYDILAQSLGAQAGVRLQF
ncbi:MAG: hypothetical protein ACLFRY_00020 [Spirochaetia bacterium]